MNNIMAYYHLCRTGFSTGQRNYMRSFIDANTNGGFLTNQLNDQGINSLYEPFAIVGVGGTQGGSSTIAYSKGFFKSFSICFRSWPVWVDKIAFTSSRTLSISRACISMSEACPWKPPIG